MGYKSELQSNNTNLQTILNTINAMEGGSEVESTFVPTDSGAAGYKGDLVDNNVDLQRILELVMSLPDIPEDITIESYPSATNSLTYTGSAQSPNWSNYDSTMLTIGGTTSATDAGSYTTTFTPNDGYVWPDGSKSAYSVTWSIAKASISTTPSQSGSLTYSGSAQSPSWSNYSSTQLTIGGTTSGTNAGIYTATFTPTSNYQWSDGTTTAKSATWSINKAAGSISFSTSSVNVKTGKSVSFTVSRNGDGVISVNNSYTSYITTTVSGTRVTVKGIAAAGAPLVITVNVAAGTNHTAVSKSITISVSDPVTYYVQFGSNAKYITDAGTMSSATTYFEEGTTIQIVYPFNTDFVDKPSFEVDGQTVSVYTFTAKNEYGNSIPVYGCYYIVNKNTHAMFYYSVMYISAA